jgi:predicted ATPase/class 3 adenylate cyclase
VAELPTGTVTFLFTDLVGSSRLWEEHPDAMQDALARHDEILRYAVEARAGRVVKSTGDGAHGVFVRAEDGVNAAVVAQVALAAEPWGVTGPLRVRMGLHTGSAELREGDYYGPALNRAARLMAAAHGGQVVVSQATADLVRDTPLEPANFVDLGEHRLRDLGRAEHVFQLIHPELSSEFPVLRTLDSMPGNLPVQLTEFVGRDAELPAVSKLLADARVVTLIGPGGVGKTRLALQSAADSIGHFPAGAWFVDLAPVDEPNLVAATVAGALQVPEPRQGSIEDALLTALRHQRLLIVLDNCEHLVDAAATFVDLVVHECVELTVLATSREAFGLVGEDTFSVKPLAVPPVDELADVASLRANDAVRLFVERATSARHGFEFTAENASAVGEVCRRLDGIPLAIELAAARVQSMSPSDILDRLNERFRLLSHGRRSGMARHQTLRAAVDWSYDILEPAEQLVFERCSVFAGGFTLDAAEAVVAGEGVDSLDVIELVSSLVAKSMVVADDIDGRVRYRILETLRDYGANRLAERGETESVRHRHALHYLAVAERAGPGIVGPDADAPLEEIAREYDNLRAALVCSEDKADQDTLARLACALAEYWHQRGLWRDGLTWTQAARTVDGSSTETPTRASLDASAGVMATMLCQWDEALEWLHASIELTGAEGKPPIPVAPATLALEALERNRPTDAVGYSEQALAAARRRNDPFWESWTLTSLSIIRALTNDEAHTSFAGRALDLARTQRNGFLLMHALMAVGISSFRTDPDTAIAAFDEAIPISSKYGHSGLVNQAYLFRGLAHQRLGHMHLAAEDLGAAVREAHISGNVYYVAIVLTTTAGMLSRHDGHQTAAVEMLAVADRLRAEAGLVGAPNDLAAQRSISDRLQRAIGPESFERAWTGGRETSLDEMVVIARAELSQLATSQS